MLLVGSIPKHVSTPGIKKTKVSIKAVYLQRQFLVKKCYKMKLFLFPISVIIAGMYLYYHNVLYSQFLIVFGVSGFLFTVVYYLTKKKKIIKCLICNESLYKCECI